jgi:hypothetical protein
MSELTELLLQLVAIDSVHPDLIPVGRARPRSHG